LIIIGRTEAKAIKNNFFVGQERKLGDQNRLETDVVLAVNDAFQRIFLEGCLSLVTLQCSLRITCKVVSSVFYEYTGKINN